MFSVLHMSVVTETGIESPIFRIFERLVSDDPAAPAVYEGTEVISRAELLSSALEISVCLRQHGVHEGQVLALQMRNSTTFLATVAAALSLRATILPIDRDARQTEVESILDQFAARAIVRHDETGFSIEPCTGDSFEMGTALIKLTSGSTGRPRGVLTTEQNLIADCGNICATMGITPSDVNLGAIPFSHSYGFSNLVTPLLLQGTSVVVSNDYMPLSLMDLANRHRVTFVPGIPMMYDHLSRLPTEDGTFETVRRFISAGAPLSPNVARAFRERHGASIHSFYGCSECGGITYDRLGGAAERGTVGAAMKNVGLEIDPVTRRLRVRSEAAAAGYVNATTEESAKFDCDRFLTDDLVERTENEEIRIVGRANVLINIAGKKINPREIENVILTIPGVREVNVFGAPGGSRGEIVTAAVVADSAVTRRLVRERCMRELSAHKVPRVVKFLTVMPVDERGKLKKIELL